MASRMDTLPADSGAQVLHSHFVVGSLRRSILVQPWSSGVSSPERRSSSVPVSSRSFSMFNTDSLTQEFLSIELVDCIISISVIIKLNKSKTFFDEEIIGFAVALEELLQVSLPDSRRHVADVDSAPIRHFHLFSPATVSDDCSLVEVNQAIL